jgi:hypothetical protein
MIGSAGLVWFVASAAVAATSSDSQWSEPVSLPRASASSTITNDGAVQLVSDSEPADSAAASSCEETADCHACNMCCPCGPIYYGSVGTVILHRARPESLPLIVPTAGPGVIANGGDFNFGWDAGVDMTFGYRTSSCSAWEFRYFNDDDASADPINYGAVGNVRIGSFSNFGATNLTATRYLTSLHSSELNYVREVNPRCEFLTGFRWIELEDDINFNIVFPAFNADYTWNENNHMYGAQMGTRLNMWELNSPLQLLGTFKAGIYGNVADNDFTLRPSTGGQFDGGGFDTQLAFVGEIDFTASYQLTQHFSVYGGYQVLWLDGVALASDALAASTAASSQAVITENQLVYQGAVTGINFVW